MSKTISDTANIFKALADETRLKIIKLLTLKGNSICVGFIAKSINISQPAVSQHLKILKNVNLVEADRQGFHVHYSIKKDCLDSYDIDIFKFLSSFGEEFKYTSCCEHNSDSEKCNK